MRRSLNLRFLIYLFAGIAAAGVGVHFLHGYQIKRNAGVFLEQADRAEEQKQFDRAAELLGRYLALAPRDTKVLARYGLLLDRLATSPQARLRAYQVLEKVLRALPEEKDIRRRQAKLALSLRLFGDAKDHLEKLRTNPPSDGEVEELLGTCYFARGKYPLARAAFDEAIKLDRQRIDSYVALARLYREHKDEVREREKTSPKDKVRKGEKTPKVPPPDYLKLADAKIEEMVTNNPDSYRAYLNRALYRRQTAAFGKQEEALKAAETDLAIADQKSQDEADVLLASADLAQAQEKKQKARDFLARGCKKHPQDARMYQLLGRLELEDGKTEAAEACLREGLKKLIGNHDLQWELANTLIEAKKLDEAARHIEQLRKEHVWPASLDFLQARLLITKKEWLGAIRLLERAYPLLTAQPRRAEQAGLLLSIAWEQLGDWDRAFSAYSRVCALVPLSVPGRLGAARMLARMGQIPEALDHLHQLYKLPRVPVAALTLMAHLMIARNRQSDQPDWGEVKNLLAQLEKAHPSDEVAILSAEIDLERPDLTEPNGQQRQLTRARERLENFSKADKRPVAIWTALAALEDRQRGPAAALAYLDQAEKQLGNRSELLLARLRYLPRLAEGEARQGLETVLRQNEKLPLEEQAPVLQELGSLYLRRSDRKQAKQVWDQLVHLQKDSLLAHLGQLDVALSANDSEEANRIIEDMRRIEGPEGTVWRYAAASNLIEQARNQENPEERKRQLHEARPLLIPVGTRRPKWSRVPFCQAQIDDLLGKTDAALVSYQRAIQLGDRNAFTIQRAAQLLTAKTRYAEAHALLNKLPANTPLSDSMQKLYAEVSLQSGNDVQGALERARKAVEKSAEDYQSRLWYGRMLWRADKPDEAEKEFRLATRLAEQKPEVWVTLIQLLVNRKRLDDARKEIEKARQKLAKDQADLALGQCYTTVGDLKQARHHYEEALAAHAKHVPTLQGLVGVCLRSGDSKGAQSYLRKIVQLKGSEPEAARAAQRTLALIMAAGGDFKETQTALAMMGLSDNGGIPTGAKGPETAYDLRTQVLLLTMSGTRKKRQQAIVLLEKLVQYPEATIEDRFLLAQLYEATGAWVKARKAFQIGLSLPRGDDPRYLALCARVFLTHDETEFAEALLKRLAKQEPTSFRTVALQAQLSKLRGKSQDAVEKLEQYARGPDVNLGEVAVLLEGLKEWDAAERMYRRYCDATREKRPENVLILVQFLGRRERLREALDLCEEAWKTCQPLPVTQVALVLVSTRGATSGDWTRVERWFQAEIAKSPKTSAFQVALAHLRNLQERYDDAEAIYRQALASTPRDPIALNNLAFLLALRGVRLEEATQLVETAYEQRGPRPFLLDTRAVIFLKKGDSQRALKDLAEAVADAPSATLYFHLAEARRLVKDRAAARIAFQQALALGLKASNLHPLEKESFDRLMREFPQ